MEKYRAAAALAAAAAAALAAATVHGGKNKAMKFDSSF